MPKGDSVIVACPHCGRQASYQLRSNNTGEVHGCRHCGKNFVIDVQNGRVREVRK